MAAHNNTVNNYKNPPIFDDPALIDVYLQELKIWQLCTDLQATKQGPAVFLSLPPKSKARQTVLAEVSAENMAAATGVKFITDALEKAFKVDKDQHAFTCFDEFITFRRPVEMTTQDFLVKFNLLYNKVKGHNATIPEPMLAYFLLQSANCKPF